MRTKPTQKFYKPLPYTLLPPGKHEKTFAEWLRTRFSFLLKKRLPTLYYSGFSHGYIPHYIQKHKKRYPYVLKADITKFYPNILHKELIVQTQIAFKKLTASSYVPTSFKKEFLPQAYQFLDTLALKDVGLPLNSGVSKSWATLIYVPLLLDIKKQYDCKFIVFVDDFLFMTQDVRTQELIYTKLHNSLAFLGLSLNRSKVKCGRLGKDGFTYCGYHFKGGYVSIGEEKITAFKERFKSLCKQSKNKPLKAFIKRVNYRIQGFGHYYKFGNVKRLFRDLDRYITTTIRQEYLTRQGYLVESNYVNYLYKNGLYSLQEIASGISQSIQKEKKTYQQEKEHYNSKNVKISLPSIELYLEKLVTQNKQILRTLNQIEKSVRWS